MSYKYRQPKFDFSTNEFVLFRGAPIIISGRELLMQEIQKVIRTELNRFDIYKDFQETYGCPLEDKFIGSTLPQNYAKAEIERVISEALAQIDGVTAVNSFSTTQTDNTLYASFNVISVFGTLNEEVKLNG